MSTPDKGLDWNKILLIVALATGTGGFVNSTGFGLRSAEAPPEVTHPLTTREAERVLKELEDARERIRELEMQINAVGIDVGKATENVDKQWNLIAGKAKEGHTH